MYNRSRSCSIKIRLPRSYSSIPYLSSSHVLPGRSNDPLCPPSYSQHTFDLNALRIFIVLMTTLARARPSVNTTTSHIDMARPDKEDRACKTCRQRHSHRTWSRRVCPAKFKADPGTQTAWESRGKLLKNALKESEPELVLPAMSRMLTGTLGFLKGSIRRILNLFSSSSRMQTTIPTPMKSFRSCPFRSNHEQFASSATKLASRRIM